MGSQRRCVQLACRSPRQPCPQLPGDAMWLSSPCSFTCSCFCRGGCCSVWEICNPQFSPSFLPCSHIWQCSRGYNRAGCAEKLPAEAVGEVGVVGGSVCLLGFYPRRLCCKSPYHRLNENLSKYERPNKL